MSSLKPSPYLFELDSEMWHINHQKCGLIFGPAAAILQIAHPRIAQGVAEHSDFRTDPTGRLQRTLDATNGIAFGTIAEAEQIKQRINKIHGKVRGETAPGMHGPNRYSVFEPDLLLWVLATLVVASVQGWEMVYGPLPLNRRENFYRDMLRFGTYFGIRQSDCPQGWQEFAEYYHAMIHGNELASHSLCAEVCKHIVYPRSTIGNRLLGHGLRFMIIETFPVELREKMGLRSTPVTRLKMRALRRTVTHWFPRLPEARRIYPKAVQRIVAARNQTQAGGVLD